MTVEQQATGAVSHQAEGWHDIDWQKAHREVRRLQARIVKATQEGRWGKVKALQRLLTRSHSAKVLAVRRVTENKGKKTPGIDGVLWNTPLSRNGKRYKGSKDKDGYRSPTACGVIHIPKSSSDPNRRNVL